MVCRYSFAMLIKTNFFKRTVANFAAQNQLLRSQHARQRADAGSKVQTYEFGVCKNPVAEVAGLIGICFFSVAVECQAH